MNPDEMPDEPHLPSPSLWPIGFAIGIAVILVGLIIDPLWVSTIGGAAATLPGKFELNLVAALCQGP